MIETKLPKVGTTIFTKMSALAQACGALNLSQGFPDFEAPLALREALGRQAMAGHNQYAPMAGLLRLREAVAASVALHRGVIVDPETEITIVPGATEGIFCTVQALVRAGDEVILFDPAYDSYEPAVDLAGGRAIRLPLTAPEFQIDWDRFEDALSDKTRLVMINSPHNPCGTNLESDALRRLAEFAERYDFYVCSDEVYEHLVYEGSHRSVLQELGLRERSVAHFSFGKTFSVTGWKTGYCIAPPALTAELRKVHQYVAFVAVTPVQHALADFMEAEPNYAFQLADDYRHRRDVFLNALQGSRFTWTPSQGSFFQLLDYSAITDEPDHVLCERWTREHGVASIPLTPFYREAPKSTYLRFCFAKSDAVLLEAAQRLCAI
ncbi:MAG: methionine aminotransferase [Aequoribacter sp.]|uniref:methionine aminotransferase n=3 Tax=Aequoribacter sp. TaxID=2847771 RepID=UPI003C4853B6